MTVAALFGYVRDRLREGGLPEAGREARQLIGALIDVPATVFIGHPERLVPGSDCARVLAGVGRRLEGMPIGRIVGVREFYGRAFRLGPAVLEPRADSEVLIEAALQIVREAGWCDRPVRLIDVGTGSGCLLVTLLAELPRAIGVGVDLAREALAVAELNAADHGVAGRATFIEGDALAGVEGRFDLLVSNPPYIRTGDIAGLDIEVRAHDPVLALDGGIDGLDIYRRIARDVSRVVPDGWMLFEAGAGMATDVCREIDQKSGFSAGRSWQVWQDLNGYDRCVAAKTLNY